MRAVRHGVVVVHAMFIVHATHPPLPLQTWFVPQDRPAAASPVALHTGAPVEHASVPVRQGSVGVHAIPTTQGTHVPVGLQTPPGQVVVPAGRLPLSVQTGAPLVHTIAAV